MKKVLILGSSISIGGAQKQQFLLKEKLEEDGFEVDFCFVYIKKQSDRFGWINSNKEEIAKIQYQIYHPYYYFQFNPSRPVRTAGRDERYSSQCRTLRECLQEIYV